MQHYTEQNQETSLFGFGIDQSSRAHLAEAAKWAKFLAIVGFVICGLIIVLSFFIGTLFSTSMSRYDTAGLGSSFGIIITIVYLGIGILYFFPCLFLFKFANNMITALNSNEQITLNRSFQNLKIMFRYVGILTIIVFGLYIIAFVFGILGAAFMSR
jgi:hypothetical protein